MRQIELGDVLIHLGSDRYVAVGYDIIKAGWRVRFAGHARSQIQSTTIGGVGGSPLTNWRHVGGEPVSQPRLCRTCLLPISAVPEGPARERYCQPYGSCNEHEHTYAIYARVPKPLDFSSIICGAV